MIPARLIICLVFPLVILTPLAVAADCSATHLNEAADAIRNASGCQAGIALYESCGAKATSYHNLAVLALEAQSRCEKIFLDSLHGEFRRIYKLHQTNCLKQYLANRHSLFYTPRSLCGPYFAQEYARAFIKAKEELARNPNPPL